jgi:hypothetical protein
MYSWGSNTIDWKKPGTYKYDSARSPYLDKLADASAKKGGRTYLTRSSPNMKMVGTNGKEISSESENPLIIAVDVTGSMASWPKEIFDRLPLLYQTISQYRPDLEVCFAAIGDANSDTYPIQVNDFAKGVDLEDKLNAIYPEGGGGGQISESYELFGHFIDNHCKLPKATNPFLFIYGDEKFYDTINPDQVKHYIGDSLESGLDSKAMWSSLMQKFNLFYLHKPYGNEDEPSVTKDVGAYWAKAIGPQRVIELPSMERAVDVAMAILAKYYGQYGDFKTNIAARQDEDEIGLVEDSVRLLPNDPGGPIMRASRLLGSGSSKKSKRLDGA